MTVSASPQALSAAPVVATAFSVKAPSANAGTVFIGNSGVSTSSGHYLEPGDFIDYEHNDQHGEAKYLLNVSDFYVTGTSGDKISWLASPVA